MNAPLRRTPLAWLEIVRDILGLVDVEVTIEELKSRTLVEVLAAEEWASLEHLAASDNEEIVRKPKPSWLPPSSTERRLAKWKEAEQRLSPACGTMGRHDDCSGVSVSCECPCHGPAPDSGRASS